MYINFNNIFNFRFNAVKYRVLLRDQVIPKLREKYPMPQHISFMQDRCSIHQAAIIQNFLDDQPNFSVMNPIENLWGLIVRSLDVDPQWRKEEFI